MNTNQLKKFAQDARRKLLEQVGAKLSYVLSADTAELREKTGQIKQLREELQRTSKEQLIEKVAYTWFNRLMALRFMDANDYQPLGIRIITPKDGYTIPEILDEAKRGNLPDELHGNKQRVYDLLDGKIPSNNPQNEAYRDLLIASCNHLNSVFPFLFERINDYTELLLPDDLTSDFSIVTAIRNGMAIGDCKEVEIIGWLYQFYISEEKDRLINAKKKYQSHEIAPVTQLFTPKWIVQYMVDNTLGQFWKEARPSTKIIDGLEFYIKPHNETLIPQRIVHSPEEITFFDPCVGSAHILCYAFDILFAIYQEEGYDLVQIPELIIQKNLFGIDIDERAAQLAAFSLMMKGRQKSRRLLRRKLIPNITAFKNIEFSHRFHHAESIGSLIKITQAEVEEIEINPSTIYTEQQIQLRKQASFLAEKYDIVVTNPPYLNSAYMQGELKQYVDSRYKSTKTDLFACFIIQASNFAKPDGLIGFISPYVWMFINSYVELRDYLIKETTIASLIQLEYNAFEPACVPVATYILRNQYIPDYVGSYIKLSDFKGYTNQAPKTLEAINNPNCTWLYKKNQIQYHLLPKRIIGYNLSTTAIANFQYDSIGKHAIVNEGLKTRLNDRFIKFWFEIPKSRFGHKWFLYSKGGGTRFWFGNNWYVIDWENDGIELKSYPKSSGTNFKKYRVSSLTYSTLGSSRFSVREMENSFFGGGGGGIISDSKKITNEIIAFLNSIVGQFYISTLSQTLNFEVGDIKAIPFLKASDTDIGILGSKCVVMSKEEWDSKEESINYGKNELLIHKDIGGAEISKAFNTYCRYWEQKFLKLHQLEELINHRMIQLYGLEKDLDSDIAFEDITILQSELDVKVLARLNRKLTRDPETHEVLNYNHIELPFISNEIMAQFISYSVGCMFGRYSIDKEGLILANQGESINDFEEKITEGRVYSEPIEGATAYNVYFPKIRFYPDVDNIIPVLEQEWFEDDIVGRFYEFLKVTFGEENFNKNLAFIEEQIGKDIRTYFLKDFYPDHIKRYKKRPIYWMFSSPNGSFNALIYMHRYTPDTISIMLNKYLKEFMGKLNSRKEHLQQVQVSGTASEQTKAIKEIDKIDRMLLEMQEYERDVLFPLATERISIDLDDGVLVNYNKFGKAVKEVAGLNDKKTKEKVRQFDWIDTTQIR